jgi:maltose alpha-D-glucosyltransferase / alpha-amylase
MTARPPLEKKPRDLEWYRDAVLYEVRVRSFYDSDADGIGDFKGLAQKLDYLSDLGITAVWLLPFYPSPLKDDGYDISDYGGVHPDMGSLADFQHFLDEAHARGLRVVTELVLNHTSDQHPWFQRARRAPPNSPERDFYVWSDNVEKYKDARIIFKDFEPSNWTWDPVARAYYWHRFYSHQPDLNFDNPAVLKALFEVVDFWMGMGVDGLRLDAVPYLYEREGTSSENLPETHELLKALRRHVDDRYEGRMLLAEANQWPEDAVAYFGQGDECHMAFHFPIMPRLFMAIHLEDRFPLIDILAQTPDKPESCQWALFLRNHDELTLEMVTDEERDYMYRAYAREQPMRLNLGIRRRLGPLLGNDRRRIELMNALLFSLPGTPVLYYGDEIGMGDNVFLGDRNGVRTPMQWSSDRNAGFSRANPQRLILPVIIDPEYHFEAVNVEAQQNNGSSLLWWTKRLIALRKRFSAFGRGSIEFLSPENPRVLAFIRRYESESILVVANLSRSVQFVELDLSRLRGSVPVELFGGTEFPAIGELPYLLTLGGHAFYWFSLTPPSAEAALSVLPPPPPVMEIAGPWETAFSPEMRPALGDALRAHLASRRWFSSPPLRHEALRVEAAAKLGASPVWAALCAAKHERDEDRFFVPLVFEPGDRGAELKVRAPHAVAVELRPEGGLAAEGVLADVASDPALSRALLAALLAHARARTAAGEIVASTTGAREAPSRDLHELETRSLSVDPAMTAVVFGDELLLEIFRRLDEGTSPDLEIGRHLLRHPIASSPPVLGAIELRPPRGEAVTLAILRAFVPNQGDMQGRALEELRRYFERALTRSPEEAPIPPADRAVFTLAHEEAPPAAAALIGSFLDVAELLGRRTAEIHRALAAGEGDPAFAPEPFSSFDQRSLYQSMRNQAGTVLRTLRIRPRSLPAPLAEDATALLAREALLMRRLGAVREGRLTGLRTRIHGDYHLGRVLFTGKDFVVPSFEGDRRKPLSERRRKTTPLRDVAVMVCSIHEAAMAALYDEAVVRREDRGAAMGWAHLWQSWVSASFVRGWLSAAEGAVFLPRAAREMGVMLDALGLEEALEDLEAELEKASERARVPLSVLARLLDLGVEG